MSNDGGMASLGPEGNKESHEVVVSSGSVPDSSEPKKVRPRTLLALVEHAYAEGGRKLNLARKDLLDLKVDLEAADDETAAVRRLAASDPLLAVPVSLLASVAELRPEPAVRRRIIELVSLAVASHGLFSSRYETPEAAAELSISAREVFLDAKRVTAEALGFQDVAEFKAPARDRLRTNAVTTVSLVRVLRDAGTFDQFVQDMTEFVWTAPPQRVISKAAAVLASAKNTEALSQLSRHFEALLQDSRRATAGEAERAVLHGRRAAEAESERESLRAELDAQRVRGDELMSQAAELRHRLEVERSSRVVDKSHHVDDYEGLRTQILRRLTTQVELLSDGLHALRNGSTAVAEEFVDRALTAIDGEVKRLRGTEGAAQ